MLDGTVHPDFADVAATLIRLLPSSGHGGGAATVYHRGRCVADLWGGSRDDAGSPWSEDTIAPSFSTGKGMVATLMHMLIDQGKAAYDDPVARHWPGFEANGKERITIRQVLCHEAGLYRITDMIASPREMLDWEHMCGRVAAAVPAHQPGAAHGYHAFTFGWLVGGLIERLTGKSLADALADELVAPLGLDGCFFGLPQEAMPRRAHLANGMAEPPSDKPAWRENAQEWIETGLARVGVDLAEFRNALMPFDEAFDWNAEETVQAAIPGANGQFTARSLARVYAMLAEGGEIDDVRLVSRERLVELSRVENRGRDRVLMIPMHWRLGYHRAFTLGKTAPDAFGHYGYGGSGAFCDPSRRLAVALTVNTGSGTPAGDWRMPRLARAAIGAADRIAAADPAGMDD